MGRLAPGLLDHFWQSTVVAALALLLLAAVGRFLSARTRRAIALLGLLKFVLPTGVLWPARQPLPDWIALPNWLRAAPPAAAQVGQRPVVGAVPLGESTADLVIAVYLAGVGVLAGIAALRACRCARAAAGLQAADERVRREAAAAAELAGLPTIPAVVIGPADVSPVAAGVLRGAIIVPQGLEQALSPEELRIVLLHECLHVRARDNLWRFAQGIALASAWFHPLAWILARRAELETEMSRDEAVLTAGVEPASYVSALARTVRHVIGLLPPSVSAAGAGPFGLRLGNIVAFRRPAPPGRRWLGGAVLGAMTAAVAASRLAGSLALPPTHRGARATPAGAALPLVAAGSASTRPLLVSLVAPDDDGAAPWPIFHPSPLYPERLRAAGISGEATLEVVVGEDGGVSEPALESYDDLDFGAAATAAILQWRFRPAHEAGHPVRARKRIRLRFHAADGTTDALLLAGD